MPLLNDRVRQAVSAAPGTGSIQLGAAIAGFRTYGAAGTTDGQLTNYVLEDGTAFEWGVGVYSASGPSIARTTILGSSNNGAAINATASAVVYCDAFASNLSTLLTIAQIRAVARRAVNRYAVR